MIAYRMRSTLPLWVLTITMMLLAGGVGSALAAAPPVKLVLSSRFGREVNLTEVNAKAGPALEDVCTVESGDVCQEAREGSIAGAFAFAEGVAGAAGGNVYVADNGNGRVQELTSTGEFVLMFGREVDATTKGDICTAASKDVCKAGVKGTAAGQLAERSLSVAVDPVSGDVYLAEESGFLGALQERVQAFTSGGQFVWEIGKEVNETTKMNLCTQIEAEKGVKCVAPAASVPGSSEHGAFNFAQGSGKLAVGGESDLLYLGDEGRVQELDAETGEWKGEIPLEPAGGKVSVLAIDEETSDLYLVYGEGTVIKEFDAKGEPVKDLVVTPRIQGNGAQLRPIDGLAVDAGGHLAVAAVEAQFGQPERPVGVLYDAGSGHRITEFAVPYGGVRLGFNGLGELFGATSAHEEVVAYKPEFVAELLTGVAVCVPGVEVETSVTLACTMNGEVNPEGVSGTEAWFEWGRSEALGEETPKQKVEATGPVQATIGARPNEAFYYQLAGEDLNVKQPEQLTGERMSFITPIVAPKVVGEPSASFVKASSAVMFGELNPENTNTEYFFEYGEGEALGACPGVNKVGCPGVTRTAGAQSAVYGRIATTMEAAGLQPDTTYHYRLAASNEHEVSKKVEGGEARGAEGSFTTGPAPVPRTETGSVSAVTATGATVSGMVDPDGLPATYAFELGVYNGASTQYGIVFSGAAGASSVPVEESLVLTGLQPGTTYAYRITISSGYVKNELHTLRGEPMTFTTGGLASVLALPTPLAQLPVPSIAFPASVIPPKTKAVSKKKAKKKKKNKKKKVRRSSRRSSKAAVKKGSAHKRKAKVKR